MQLRGRLPAQWGWHWEVRKGVCIEQQLAMLDGATRTPGIRGVEHHGKRKRAKECDGDE
jgi:hypothetical protein